jgi:hypothetical protein
MVVHPTRGDSNPTDSRRAGKKPLVKDLFVRDLNKSLLFRHLKPEFK